MWKNLDCLVEHKVLTGSHQLSNDNEKVGEAGPHNKLHNIKHLTVKQAVFGMEEWGAAEFELGYEELFHS